MRKWVACCILPTVIFATCAAADEADLTVFGIPMGKPLSLPICPKDPGLLPQVKSNITCITQPLEKADTSYTIRLEDPPPTLTSVVGATHRGLLDTLYVWTFGIGTQDVTLSALKNKFGEPTSFEQVPYQNAYGARFVGYRAVWHNSSIHVDFDAAFLRKRTDPKDEGRISIQTRSAYDDEIQKWEQKIKNQGKF